MITPTIESPAIRLLRQIYADRRSLEAELQKHLQNCQPIDKP